jgi:O-antigen/teichoic acid export membrane protein
VNGANAAAEAVAGAPAIGRSAVARNAAHLVLGQAGTTLLAVLLSAALGRSLGAAEFGLYFVFTSMTTFAFVVVEWGQGQHIVREVACRPDAAGALLGSALAIRGAGALVAAAVTAATASLLLGHDRRGSLLATGMVLTLAPNFLAQTYGATFRGRERMEYDAVVSVLNKLLTLVLVGAALLARLGLPGVLAGQGLAGVGALAFAILLGRRVGVRARRATLAVARELVVRGTPIVAMSLAISAQAYIDAVVLTRLAPEHVVGWYAAAKNILGTLVAPAAILGTAAFPALSRAANDPARLRTEIQAAMRPLLLLAGLAGVGTYLFADVGVAIVYGRATFGPAATVLKAFAPGLFLLFVDVLLGSIIVAAGRAGVFAAAKVVNVLASTGLELVLIPFFQARYGNGGIGVVVAFAASELVMFVAAVLIIPRAALSSAFFLDLGRAVVLAGGTFLFSVALPAGAPVLAAAAAAVTFAVLAVGLRLVSRSDLSFLADVVRRRAARPPPGA